MKSSGSIGVPTADTIAPAHTNPQQFHGAILGEARNNAIAVTSHQGVIQFRGSSTNRILRLHKASVPTAEFIGDLGPS